LLKLNGVTLQLHNSLYCWESALAIRRLPHSKNNIVKYCVLQIRCKAVHQVGLMTGVSDALTICDRLIWF
jgi:hypothetical protein